MKGAGAPPPVEFKKSRLSNRPGGSPAILPSMPKVMLWDNPEKTTDWATQELPAEHARESHYRICGITGSGKSHLTKLYLFEILSELEDNPYAKLVVFEPKREFYAWLCSMGLDVPIRYFMPSDKRSVTLDFTRDYASDQDSRTLANAFYPYDPNEKQRFWGDVFRTIYAGVFDALKQQLGRADLRLLCLVLENPALTRTLLGQDPYLVQARALVEVEGGNVNETGKNIKASIDARIGEMKVLAAHLDQAKHERPMLSLRDFVNEPGEGILVVSRDADYGLVQDPMNGVLFLRLMQLLDKLQKPTQDNPRRVYIVIDEFPMLAGDKPCPGIVEMFLLLRSRGVSILITYQAHASLKRIYGESAAEIIGQTSNVIYLKQGEVDSADYAARDLGIERGYEFVKGMSISASGGYEPNTSVSISRQPTWYERPIHSGTELQNHLPKASKERGVHGKAKSTAVGEKPWSFAYPPEVFDELPKTHPFIGEYDPRDPDLGRDFREYQKHMRESQRLKPLTKEEENAILGLDAAQIERKSWDTFLS